MDRVTDFESSVEAFESRRERVSFPARHEEIQLIRMLLSRLERVSVDSYWAHRASGIRGGLIKSLEGLEGETSVEQNNLPELIAAAFEVLTEAAKEKA